MLVENSRKVLNAYASALDASCDKEAAVATALRQLARALGKAGKVGTKVFVSRTSAKTFPTSADGAHKLGELVPALQALIALLSETGSKKQLVDDLGFILDLARQHSKVSIQQIESSLKRPVASASASRRKTKKGPATMDRATVNDYIERLEAALGDDASFQRLYRDLCGDKRITKIEAVALASAFYGPTAASTSRPKALARVLRRHEKLMQSRAGSESIGGEAA